MAKANNKQNKSGSNGTQNLSQSRLVAIVAGLVILGIVIIVSSGMFDIPEPNQTVQNNIPNDDIHNHADLGMMQKINELETQVQNNPDNLESLLHLAHLLNDSGFYERAVERYNSYLKVRPNEPDVLIDMGVCYYELKKLNEAETAMKKAIVINPNHQIGHFNLGIVYQAKGEMDKSKEMWQKAVDINPVSEIGKKAKSFLNTQ